MESLAEKIFPGTWTWTLKTGQVQVDSHITEILGLDGGEKSFGSIEGLKSWIHFEDRENFSNQLNDVLSGISECNEVQHRFKRDDGGQVWVLTRLTCIRDNMRKPKFIIGSTIDLSELKDSQRQLQNFELAAQNLKQGIIFAERSVSDKNIFLINFLNQSSEKILNKKLSEILGRDLFALFPNHAHDVLSKMKSGKNAEIDGHRFSPIVDPNGMLQTIVCCLSEDALRVQWGADDSAKLFRSLSFGNASRQTFHSLNNSLAIVYGRVEQFVRKIDRGDMNIETLREDLCRVRDILDSMAKRIRSSMMVRGEGRVENIKLEDLWSLLGEILDPRISSTIDVHWDECRESLPSLEIISVLSLILGELWHENAQIRLELKSGGRIDLICDGKLSSVLFEILSVTMESKGFNLISTAKGYSLKSLSLFETAA